ncbi:MAG: hypothetical protein HON47_03720 [Candidatus Diapherotrites archaeon]|jgi:uncharacterized protein|uniref:YkgJ family cysteine cluster protein n=1 Tax=Candidatus Iainarchaeum sp. TaxID=3101447 RepID=A0A8T5GFA6_9ARCH|nr:hypothetical protein [Candidatus Diapherotrites archaeon]MBT7241036.1 hypothetical protein [Candidatus Diapherotrites archaeon]
MKSEKNICFDCDALCCREVAVSIDTPRTKEDFDEIKWLVCHKNTNVYKDHENDWLVEFASDCEHLDKNWRCKIYEKRPFVCREHSNKDCIKNSNNYHQKIFRTIEDVDKYLEEKNYKWMQK